MNKNHIFNIDIDDPNFSSELDPIKSHSNIADIYKYRPPYTNEFFTEIAKKLQLNSEMNILDICCGRGELASGLSKYVMHINAVDASAEMLKNAIQRDNITYHLSDINKNALPFATKIDHVLIGSAIHWIRSDTIQSIINNHLHEKSMILVSHTLFKFDDEQFTQSLNDLNSKYGKTNRSVDLWGRSKMNKCGYKEVDSLRLTRKVTFDINFLFMNQLSYAYHNFYENIVSNPTVYKQDFFETISPFAKNGHLSGQLINWGLLYCPSHTN